MKKSLLLLIAAGAFLFASCSKSEQPSQNKEIKLNINVSGPSSDTKAAKKAWATGDKLNIWFDKNNNQTTPDLIITFNGTNWVAGSLRAGCTPSASGFLLALYEGYNDVSSAHYDYLYYISKDWFTPKAAKEQPVVGTDSYCRPLVFYAFGIAYTFSANTLTFTIMPNDWEYHTCFKVLIKTHASMDKAANYYNLQVKNTTADAYPTSNGAWIIYDNGTNNLVGTGSANYYGWTGGVQEADGIAFYYSYFSATDANITFRLKEYDVATVKKYSVTSKTIDASVVNKCVGVQLNYGNFVDE